MDSIDNITDELAAALHEAILRHRVNFVSGNIPEHPASRYLNVNTLLYGSALLSHDDGKKHRDKKRRVNFCNYEAARIFGLPIEQIIGMPSEELAPNVGNIREDRAKALEKLLRTLQPIILRDERRWQWQPDGSQNQILIDAFLFPYQYKGTNSHAASIRLKGYYQP